MNRIEMKQLLQEKVPIFKEQFEAGWKKKEQKRKKFVKDFSSKKVRDMNLDEYVIGKGADNPSFCYRIERELDQLGRILGARADKFGVYFGKNKSDSEKKYRYAKKWGNSVEEAFSAVKESICELIDPDITWQKAKTNRLSTMLKGKILYLYHPYRFADIYSENHLKHFVAELNILTKSSTPLELQNELINYRNSWGILDKEPQLLFNKILYHTFGYPEDNKNQLPLLKNAVDGLDPNKKMKKPRSSNYKPDYEKLYKNRKRIGERGEALVLAYEKKRLKKAEKDELADKIEHVASTDDSKGFDILSYETDGRERKIEVKATVCENINHGFFLTSNELKNSQKIDNYHLYIVLSTLSEKPVIEEIPNPDFQKDYVLTSTVYKVSKME
jgi:uncharacterized protein DUF3883